MINSAKLLFVALILTAFSIGASAETKVVVIPMDSSTPKTKFISLNVYAEPALHIGTQVYANGIDAGVGGGGFIVDFNFTIPPDYSTGTSMTIRVLAYARNGDTLCNAGISHNWRFVMRAGVGEISTAWSPNRINHVMTQDNVPEEFLFSFVGDSGSLQAGDSVAFGLFASGLATACDLIISGVSVQYQ